MNFAFYQVNGIGGRKPKLHREFRAQLLPGRKADRKCNGFGGIEYAIVSWGSNDGGRG